MAGATARVIFCSTRQYFVKEIYPWKEVYRCYAGHSKWANIKNIKETKDKERASVFTRLSRQMRVAIAEGGSASPESNLQLARTIDQAKKLNMPVASIQHVLKSAEKDVKVPKKQLQMEIKGPGGYVLIVEVLTSNFPKTKAEISPYLKKAQATLTDGVKYMFDKRGIIQATSQKVASLDETIEIAIEGGADDVDEVEGEDGKLIFQFYSDPDALHSLKSYLESKDYSVHSASVEYLPLNRIELNEENAKLASKLLWSLNDHLDVVGVYDNFS